MKHYSVLFIVIGLSLVLAKEFSSRIIGGTPAELGEFPFVVAVASNTLGVFCGGAIIHSRFILTAAHCFDNYNEVRLYSLLIQTQYCLKSPSDLYIVTGRVDLDSEDGFT